MESLVDMIVCQLSKISAWIFLGTFFFLASCTRETEEKQEELETLPFYNSADFDAEWISSADPKYLNIHTIDTFSLVNQCGQMVHSTSLKGYIYVANFFFTTCSGICPTMTTNLKALQDTFASTKKVKMISFSVMPWADSVSVLKNYAEIHGINSFQWNLLTGSKERIYELGRKSFFAEKGLGLKKNDSEFMHTESMLLIDKNGRIRGIYNATQKVDVQRVIDDIQVLLREP